MSRHIPVYQEPRWYTHDHHYDPFARERDYHSSHGALTTYRDPFRDMVTHHMREPSVYHPPPPSVAGPISRSFFNPERQLSTMDSEMQRMASEMKRVFTDMQHMVPVDSNPESWRVKENFHLDNPVHQDHGSGRRMFRVQFDVRQFRPEEIVVKTQNNQLEVHAKHGEQGDNKSVHREYHRQYQLPRDLNPETLVSKLNRDGVLTIEAPLPALDHHRDNLIPIKHE